MRRLNAVGITVLPRHAGSRQAEVGEDVNASALLAFARNMVESGNVMMSVMLVVGGICWWCWPAGRSRT